jgi:hypothetical protein
MRKGVEWPWDEEYFDKAKANRERIAKEVSEMSFSFVCPKLVDLDSLVYAPGGAVYVRWTPEMKEALSRKMKQVWAENKARREL